MRMTFLRAALLPALLCFSAPLNALDLASAMKAARSGEGAGPVPQASALAPALPEWTVMVFINGKNDLENFGLKDLNEMEAVGSTKNMNVVAEMGLLRKGVKRYFVKKDGGEGVGSQVVQDLGSPDMGDWKELAAFGKWARAAYPARRYLLVVWNHGSGWVSNKGISYDDETKNHISTPELAQALREIGRVDIFAMDACLMQMAEVAYEVKDLAEYIVASEETAPGNGLPYDRVLRSLDRSAAAGAGEIAGNIVRDYIAFYQGGSQKATLSAVKTAALPRFAELADAWASAALAYPDKQALRDAAEEAAEYAIDEYKDLCDVTEKVAARTGDAGLRAAGEALRAYIKTELVTASGATANMGAGSNGVSVYVSRDGASERYRKLLFAQATRWDDFLASLPRYFPPPPFDPLDPYGDGQWLSRGAPRR